MSFTVKSISVIYNPLNENSTFTNGDLISGQVILEVSKETEMQSLSVQIKGKASVLWTEHNGQSTVVYSDKEKFYSMERFFVQEDRSHGNDQELLKDPSGQPYNQVVAPGRHVYPFTFQLPQQSYPPSFKGSVGKIVYTLRTKLCRSMRVSNKAKVEFHYLPKADALNPELLVPQYGAKDKQLKVFSSGSVSMNVNTEKTGYYLDEEFKVLSEIQNNSSRAIKPKYQLYEKHSFLAHKHRKISTHDILKEEGEPILSKTNKNVTKVLTVPPTLTVSILNCKVIKVEYRLKVYLDVPYASDPEIKFPVVFLPPRTTSGAKDPSKSDFGIWNQQAGGSAYPNAPHMGPGQFGAPGHYGPSPGQFGPPGYHGPSPSQFGAPANFGPPGQYAVPGYPGPPSQFSPPGYPGPPSQFSPPGYTRPPTQPHPLISNTQQSDPSAPPSYQKYQLYPQVTDDTKKS